METACIQTITILYIYLYVWGLDLRLNIVKNGGKQLICKNGKMLVEDQKSRIFESSSGTRES